jgi:DNA-binding response OmpR family regulator
MTPLMTGRRILIVEDEPLIAMMLEDFVDALGHTVAGTADCVSTALPLVEDGAFDMVILDINLRGGERAWPVADALKAKGKPFLLASGGHTEAFPEPHRDAPMIGKPYTMDGIREALNGLVP